MRKEIASVFTVVETTTGNLYSWEQAKNMTNSEVEKKRILLVEDHEDAWEMVAFNLPEYNVMFARDVEEGLRLARQLRFDLYILDNWLPDGSGVGLCHLIREFDPHTPILFYSAAAYARDKQEAFRAGAQAYFVKPINFAEFKQAVTQLTSVAGKLDLETMTEDRMQPRARNLQGGRLGKYRIQKGFGI